jgi:transcriptional regulator with XRE-family HTH domain
MMIFSAQIRAARALLGISQAELAIESKISIQSIQRYEQDDIFIKKASTQTMEQIKGVLEDRGVRFVFLKEDGKIIDIGVRLSI